MDSKTNKEKTAFHSRYGQTMREVNKELKEENEELRQHNKSINNRYIAIIVLLIIFAFSTTLTFMVLSYEKSDNPNYQVKVVEKEQMYIPNYAHKISYKYSFMSWMPYTAITAKNSPQYRITRAATWDEDGLMIFDDMYLVALGSGWGEVGDVFLISLSNGHTFKAMMGDQKANIHTDNTNKYCLHDGSILEFIVNKQYLNPFVKRSGTVTSLPDFNGAITNIINITKGL